MHRFPEQVGQALLSFTQEYLPIIVTSFCFFFFFFHPFLDRFSSNFKVNGNHLGLLGNVTSDPVGLEVWGGGGALGAAFLLSSQVMRPLPAPGPHPEPQGSR